MGRVDPVRLGWVGRPGWVTKFPSWMGRVVSDPVSKMSNYELVLDEHI